MIKFIKKKKWILLTLVIIFAGFFYFKTKGGAKTGMDVTRIKPAYGMIKKAVSTMGEVKPQNRLEIKSPIGGRIEKIFFQEGDVVKMGDVLALLSSTERSSLLDAAKLKDQETLTYWEEVYKPIPLVSPIDGEVIVRNFESGQSVTTSDPVLVLSDQLIVVAQVDETDIGHIKKGQRAVITLDAYPDIEVEGTVSHISFESLLINNVTIYEVNIVPDEIPDVFRSGMSANADIVRMRKEDILLLPNYVIESEKPGHGFVTVEASRGRVERVAVVTGITDDENTEVVSGLDEKDTVIWSLVLGERVSRRETGTNPFMPNRQRR